MFVEYQRGNSHLEIAITAKRELLRIAAVAAAKGQFHLPGGIAIHADLHFTCRQFNPAGAVWHNLFIQLAIIQL